MNHPSSKISVSDIQTIMDAPLDLKKINKFR